MKLLMNTVTFALMLVISNMVSAKVTIIDGYEENFSMKDNVSNIVIGKSAGSRRSQGKHGWFTKR